MRVLFSVNDLKCLDFIHLDGNEHAHVHEGERKKVLSNTYMIRAVHRRIIFFIHFSLPAGFTCRSHLIRFENNNNNRFFVWKWQNVLKFGCIVILTGMWSLSPPSSLSSYTVWRNHVLTVFLFKSIESVTNALHYVQIYFHSTWGVRNESGKLEKFYLRERTHTHVFNFAFCSQNSNVITRTRSKNTGYMSRPYVWTQKRIAVIDVVVPFKSKIQTICM